MMCASSISQTAGLEALRHGDAAIAEMRDAYHLRRNFIVASLNEMGLGASPRCVLRVSIDPVYGLSSRSLPCACSTSVMSRVRAKLSVPAARVLALFYATGMTQLKEAMERMEKFVSALVR